ncbi:hypothetical protein [Streptomyces sp. NBC_00576]|uniref:hypothetical protein n=1 Tax=Streptomyces sp. NBC_00576 TaxID=2903665 RepID=UPI002E8210F0|nr:hypothetical protein [Streptomyces sp. NBC_00576]WUB72727.1 hypothetical protein OG734_22905 [Streptomyces sp. NBC_00576]
MNRNAHLLPVSQIELTWRRDLFDSMRGIGWERMPAAFALPVSGPEADYRGASVPPGVAFSTERRATSAMGSRTFTLRTLDLDFELVGRVRLRRAGVDQHFYSLAHALDGDDLVSDVLLAEAWARTRTFAAEPTTGVLERYFARLEHRVEQIDTKLIRFRLAAWRPRHAD